MHLVFLLKQSVSGPLFPPQSFVGCWLAHVLARASLADVAAMLLRSILAVLVLPHATYAHSPPQPSLSPPRRVKATPSGCFEGAPPIGDLRSIIYLLWRPRARRAWKNIPGHVASRSEVIDR